ncbi:helix-turn-helix domain-containing protein [Pseudomonas sp. Ga0074129]
MRRTLLTFLACDGNAALAAQRLHTHRNN